MSVTNAKTYCCDFCGDEHDPGKLKRLRTDRIRSVSADICWECQDRTIGELVAFLEIRRAMKEKKEET